MYKTDNIKGSYGFMSYLKLLRAVTNCIISIYFECLMRGTTAAWTERGKLSHRSL
jgi:hypothetical protein